MRFLIPATRALMASLMVLLASCGAGPWQLCLDASGHLRLKADDAPCRSSCTDHAENTAAPTSDALGGPDGDSCCTDFDLTFAMCHGRDTNPGLVGAAPASAAIVASLVLTPEPLLPRARLHGPSGPSGPLAAHRTVVLRL